MEIARRQSAPLAQIALAMNCAVAAYFVIFDAGDYLRHVTAVVYGRFWPVRSWLYLHIAAGALALIVGSLQMYLGLRRRTSSAHRWLGRLYVCSVLLSCTASLLVLQRGSVVGPVWVALLIVLAVSASLFTVRGWLAAKRRDRDRHSAWMLRSYMAMMVFAGFRLLWELPIVSGAPATTRAPLLLALAMAAALVGTELVLKWRDGARRRRLEIAA
jgi:uncharacterized membrane protein